MVSAITGAEYGILEILAADDTFGIRAECRLPAVGDGPKEAIEFRVPFNQIAAFVKNAGESVSLKLTKKNAILKSGTARYSIPKSIDPVIIGKDLGELRNNTYAIIEEARSFARFARPISNILVGSLELKGVKMDVGGGQTELLATDGLKIVSVKVREMGADDDAEGERTSIVLPARPFSVLKLFAKNNEPMEICAHGGQYMFRLQTDDFTVEIVGVRLSIEKFPNLSGLFAMAPDNRYLVKEKMLSDETKLHREMNTSDKGAFGVFKFTPEQISIETRSQTNITMSSKIEAGDDFQVISHDLPEDVKEL
ncbi:MAG: hypothetical protein ACXAEN_26720, partial [Candidatus Thorarchaeota archaeon]